MGGSDGAAPLNGAMMRTVADAQSVGRAALRLAYDVGAVIGLAARNLVSATLDAADTVAPRPLVKRVTDPSALPALRKPPAPVHASQRSASRSRRLAG
jgi:hypothetical protein